MSRTILCVNCLKPRYKTKDCFNKEIIIASELIALDNEKEAVHCGNIEDCPTCGSNNIKWIED